MWTLNHRTKKFSFYALLLLSLSFGLFLPAKTFAAAPVPFTVNTDLTTCTENWFNPVHTGVTSAGFTENWSSLSMRGAFYKSNASTNPYYLYFGEGFQQEYYASGTNKLYPYWTNKSGSSKKLWRAQFNSACEMQSITYFTVANNAALGTMQQMEEVIAVSHYITSSEYVTGALPVTFPYQNTQAVPAWSFADPPTPEPSGGGGMNQDEMIEVFAIFSGFGLCVLIAYSILKQFVVGYHA